MQTPDWAPFEVCAAGARPEPTRPIGTREGVGDRLRAAAFAELQAREAFLWAARTFGDAPAELREAWTTLAGAEQRHLDMLLERLRALGIGVAERAVSDRLWSSLVGCGSAREFALFIANAEERGRLAGERFRQAMVGVDPESARVFGLIADEEVAHVALAKRYFSD
nr:DUF455 family protein [Elusimicrobiota bacterium]